MSEIQRYRWTSAGMRMCHEPTGSRLASSVEFVTLADKTAALEAQADKHAGDIAVQATKHRANTHELGKSYDRTLRAALEAQAEEHREEIAEKQSDRVNEINRLNRQHAKELVEKDEEHEKSDRLIASLVDRQSVQIEELRKELAEKDARHAKTFRRLVEERNDADQRADRFALELAEARGEGEAALRLLRRVHRKISFTSGHLCVRCQENWPCETAVIAGISDA